MVSRARADPELSNPKPPSKSMGLACLLTRTGALIGDKMVCAFHRKPVIMKFVSFWPIAAKVDCLNYSSRHHKLSALLLNVKVRNAIIKVNGLTNKYV